MSRPTKKEIADAMDVLRRARKRSRYECQGDDCSKKFWAIQPAKFCSNRCRQRAKYRRQKAADGS
jgi:hypothetical protein